MAVLQINDQCTTLWQHVKNIFLAKILQKLAECNISAANFNILVQVPL